MQRRYRWECAHCTLHTGNSTCGTKPLTLTLTKCIVWLVFVSSCARRRCYCYCFVSLHLMPLHYAHYYYYYFVRLLLFSQITYAVAVKVEFFRLCAQCTANMDIYAWWTEIVKTKYALEKTHIKQSSDNTMQCYREMHFLNTTFVCRCLFRSILPVDSDIQHMCSVCIAY